jgi:putative PIN family toxin of toxin-antitoxin system
MKAVIDTNIVVSAIIRDRLPERVLLFVMYAPEWQWMVSDEVVQEYREVIARPKFRLSESMLAHWYAVFADRTSRVETTLSVEFDRDPKDAKFLACALASQADYLISGDSDFEMKTIGNTKIISIRQFVELFLPESGSKNSESSR